MSDLPQHVNFAINGCVVRPFLDVNGIDHEPAASTRELEASIIGETAKMATLLIGCPK
jgi:hypothetical protein